MLNNIIDIIGDIDISDIKPCDSIAYTAIILIVFLICFSIVYISLAKYFKALDDGKIEKAECIRSTMCIVYFSIILISALIPLP